MKTVTVGIIGAGFASKFHCRSFSRVAGINVRVKSIADVDAGKASAVATEFGLEEFHNDCTALLDDPEIDVIDICTPPFLHPGMTMEALAAGKHVICEKPLTGYFGAPGDETPIGDRVPKSVMYDKVLGDIRNLGKVVAESNRLFMYAENYVYSPN
ncbi:MAG TPA: Gfo/Idh/MocA family oxidoreductase, partial [Aminivibrio sp.]|nr:Gfo/Idh/MocA family oxidoreductase [Aminivibrio sp.]